MLVARRRPITPEAPAGSVEEAAEALIREARRRARRRRVRRVATVAVLVGIGAAVYAALSGGSRAVMAQTAADSPSVNAHAFRGRGDLAFISRGQLWVLDGGPGTLRRLPVSAGSAPSAPVFSRDGRWLAYVATRRQNPYGPSALWIAHADGTGAHRVHGLAVNEFIGWSPSADLIAVGVGESTDVPVGSPTALDVVAADGHVRRLLTLSARGPGIRGAIWSAVWSPGGRDLAVSTDRGGPDANTEILGVPVTVGPQPTVWLSIPGTQRLSGGLGCSHCGDKEAIADLAGWWRRWGIAFWVFDSGMTHNYDSTPLAVIRGPHARPRLIAQTLSDGVTDAVSAGPAGQLAVVASGASAGRDDAEGKTVERCSPDRLNCVALPGASIWTGPPLSCKPCFGAPATGPGSAVTLDPAWSPDETQLAYVKAPAYGSGGDPSLSWYGARRLYVWNVATHTTRRIGAISGVSLPTWSRDGRSILYVSGDGLWLADAATGSTVEIEHPLYDDSTWKHVGSTDLAFYGQIPWSRQFSWSAA